MAAPLVSVIIPVRNEELTLPSVLHSLSRLNRISDCEVIIVDGGSEDATVDVAERSGFVRVLASESGLVAQLNAGASQATAPVLWFLHADSTFPQRSCIEDILAALESPDVEGGAFHFHVRGDDFYFRIVNALVNLRSKLFTRVYGDQGIFVRTELFRRLGGFRQIQFCEDLDLVLRIRKFGKFKILPGVVATSARTWQRYGKLRTTFWHLKQLLTFERKRLEEARKERKAIQSETPIAPQGSTEA